MKTLSNSQKEFSILPPSINKTDYVLINGKYKIEEIKSATYIDGVLTLNFIKIQTPAIMSLQEDWGEVLEIVFMQEAGSLHLPILSMEGRASEFDMIDSSNRFCEYRMSFIIDMTHQHADYGLYKLDKTSDFVAIIDRLVKETSTLKIDDETIEEAGIKFKVHVKDMVKGTIDDDVEIEIKSLKKINGVIDMQWKDSVFYKDPPLTIASTPSIKFYTKHEAIGVIIDTSIDTLNLKREDDFIKHNVNLPDNLFLTRAFLSKIDKSLYNIKSIES